MTKKRSRYKAEHHQPSLDLIGYATIRPNETSVVPNIPHFVVHVIAVYSGDKLVQIKIENNTRIPRELYKVLALTVYFHPCLSSIVINKALTMTGIYELRHFLNLSNITDVILDDTYVEAANYYILLESPRRLRRLSLARCFIQDIGVEQIAAKLAFSHPASETLALLNLSSNRITDVGATYIATALRTNRCLSYLNLTNNMITDEGGKTIFEVLMQFPLSYSEMIGRNERYIRHLRKKHELIDTFITNVQQTDETDSKSAKKKASRIDTSQGRPSASYMHGRAQDMAKKLISDFKDPYHKDITLKDGVLHCNGNNILAYLNLSYNHLSYTTLKTILNVLRYQKNCARVPRGLVRVGIEGNPMPNDCIELKNINNELDNCVQNFEKKLAFSSSKSKSSK